MSIPEDIEKIYEHLDHEVTKIHYNWDIFLQLFGESEERIELLNEVAPQFFLVVQNMAVENLFLGISRLTDPYEQGRNKNWSLQAIPENLDVDQHQELRKELSQEFDEIQSEVKPIRDRRNKIIAHFDEQAIVDEKLKKELSASRGEIDRILGRMGKYLNTFSKYFEDRRKYYSGVISIGDANALMAFLKRGLKFEEMIQERKIPYEEEQDLPYTCA